MAKNVLVIGAGASGLTAAISAARSGACVTILEAQERPGRKLLVTGNGRCNLTNRAENLAQQYHGTGAALAAELIPQFNADAALNFFYGLGLLTQEKNGYVYPYTLQAVSVLEVLQAELRRLKVKLKFSERITEIVDHSAAGPGQCRKKEKSGKRSSARFSVVTPTWTYPADAVILACGSKAAPSTGASEGGYALAQRLGHTIIEPRPALVPLTCRASFLNRLAGVRCRARVTLLRITSEPHAATYTEASAFSPAEEIARETGELQWTAYGVSGIVIFQLSRYLTADFRSPEPGSRQKKQNAEYEKTHSAQSGFALSIDLLPDFGEEELVALLLGRAKELTNEPVSVLLRGVLNEKMIPAVLTRTARISETCRALDGKAMTGLCHAIKNFYLPVTGTRSFDQAQVCAGGVDCGEITEKLESCLHRELYFAGEILDVDGPCGGYNLQWAWTSGYLAGKYAAGPNTGW